MIVCDVMCGGDDSGECVAVMIVVIVRGCGTRSGA